ncbi:VOC family protein [Streptomyces sp. GC420]|uniref:VOC family protein n=1 Tax=Streptomyces sp. GC420 TaxID=2697568 RepID=UPI0037DA3C01
MLAHFLTVSDVPRSRAFYADVLGGQVVLDENPRIIKVANSWINMNRGGGHRRQAGCRAAPPEPPHRLQLPECAGGRHPPLPRRGRREGSGVLTPPIDRRAELRCCMRDPDGYLIEAGRATGLLQGVPARTHP